MGIGPISYIVLLILKVARGKHSSILTNPAIRNTPAVPRQSMDGFMPRMLGWFWSE